MNKPVDYQSKKPIQKRSRMTRQKILDAAMSHIAEIGFDKTNTNLIAKTAEVSIGTIYVHFKDKWEIFLTILDEFSRKIYTYLKSGVDQVLEQEMELEKVVEWLVRGLYREHQLNGQLNLEIARFVYKDERAAELRAFWNQKVDQEIIRLFEPYMDRIAVKNINAGIIAAHRATHQVFQYLYQNKNEAENEAVFEEFLSMMKRYLMG